MMDHQEGVQKSKRGSQDFLLTAGRLGGVGFPSQFPTPSGKSREEFLTMGRSQDSSRLPESSQPRQEGVGKSQVKVQRWLVRGVGPDQGMPGNGSGGKATVKAIWDVECLFVSPNVGQVQTWMRIVNEQFSFCISREW